MENLCLDTALQWQGTPPGKEAHVIALTLRQFLFTCAKPISWTSAQQSHSRRQLICSQIGLPFSHPNDPSSLAYPDFLITLLWVLSYFLETSLNYWWLTSKITSNSMPNWILSLSPAHSKTKTMNDFIIFLIMPIRNLFHILDFFLYFALSMPNPPLGLTIFPPK